MARRSMLVLAAIVLALLALAAPARAGGWAVLTLDALPREVRAGQSYQIGFVVRQHGKTPTNQDLNGKPLVPVLTAAKQGAPAETIRAEARQQGPIGHYVVDLALPSAGTWAWQIALPTFYMQDSPGATNAAVLAPLNVLPAAVPVPTPAPAAEPTTLLGLDPAALRWAGLAALLAALAVGVYAQRGLIGRRAARGETL